MDKRYWLYVTGDGYHNLRTEAVLMAYGGSAGNEMMMSRSPSSNNETARLNGDSRISTRIFGVLNLRDGLESVLVNYLILGYVRICLKATYLSIS